jgi:hypothetical protein
VLLLLGLTADDIVRRYRLLIVCLNKYRLPERVSSAYRLPK